MLQTHQAVMLLPPSQYIRATHHYSSRNPFSEPVLLASQAPRKATTNSSPLCTFKMESYSISTPDNQNRLRRYLKFKNESDRLQNEVDNFTHKLEQQRRTNAALDDQLPQLAKNVRIRSASLNNNLPSMFEEKKLEARIRTLENNVEHEIKKLNASYAANVELREKINILRREKNAYLEMFGKMEQDLIKHAREAEECNYHNRRANTSEERYKRRMLHLKDNAQDELFSLHGRLSQMKSAIHEDQKQQGIYLQKIDATLQGGTVNAGKADQVDPHTTVEALFKKWVDACNNCKKSIEAHQRNIKILSEAFRQISEATGINAIEEMVIGLIKSEEQNYNLYSFVNSLGSELDYLEDRYSSLEKHYGTTKNIYDQERANNIAVASQLNIQLADQRKEFRAILQETDGLSRQITKVQDVIYDLIDDFEGAGFELEVYQRMKIEDNFSISEKNVEQYLGNLEEYVSSFIRHLAYKSHQSHPEFQTIPAEQLEPKIEDRFSELLTQFKMEEGMLEDDFDDFAPMTKKELLEKSNDLFMKRLRSAQVKL